MNAPLSEMSMEELQKLSEEAFSAYYAAATKPCGDWHPGKTFPELEAATKRLEEIDVEIERRLGFTSVNDVSEGVFVRPTIDEAIGKAEAQKRNFGRQEAVDREGREI